jgi:hypothetical protein
MLADPPLKLTVPIVVDPAEKVTVPVAADGETAACKVTVCPTLAVLGVGVTITDVPILFTV